MTLPSQAQMTSRMGTQSSLRPLPGLHSPPGEGARSLDHPRSQSGADPLFAPRPENPVQAALALSQPLPTPAAPCPPQLLHLPFEPVFLAAHLHVLPWLPGCLDSPQKTISMLRRLSCVLGTGDSAAAKSQHLLFEKIQKS